MAKWTDEQKAVWAEAARILGWKWSPAHGGFINADECIAQSDADYPVASDPEDACWQSGVETLEDAATTIAEAGVHK